MAEESAAVGGAGAGVGPGELGPREDEVDEVDEVESRRFWLGARRFEGEAVEMLSWSAIRRDLLCCCSGELGWPIINAPTPFPPLDRALVSPSENRP